MELVNLFSMTLSELIGVAPSHGVALLRLAIRDMGKNPDQALTYTDFKQVFQDHLCKRLVSLDVKNTDAVISKLVIMLDERQSLLTMTVR